jgi:hypothetical protein
MQLKKLGGCAKGESRKGRERQKRRISKRESERERERKKERKKEEEEDFGKTTLRWAMVLEKFRPEINRRFCLPKKQSALGCSRANSRKKGRAKSQTKVFRSQT